jgi:maltose alpha-D-glucosyltransferase/alpha-amylase
MHNALASQTDLPDFQPEPITRDDVEGWEQSIEGQVTEMVERLHGRLDQMQPDLQDVLRRVIAGEPDFLTALSGLDVLVEQGCHKTRYHGDYHLGQVLKTGDDFIILDFEGEPARTLEERRAKHCPLKDVAGMLRSFSYAAYAVLFEVWEQQEWSPQQKAELESWALLWEQQARDAFMEGYCDAASRHTGPRYMPQGPDAFNRVVTVFQVEKAFYELNYEFNNRPTWVPIPANGLLRLLG